jgi:hypothetical protein
LPSAKGLGVEGGQHLGDAAVDHDDVVGMVDLDEKPNAVGPGQHGGRQRELQADVLPGRQGHELVK